MNTVILLEVFFGIIGVYVVCRVFCRWSMFETIKAEAALFLGGLTLCGLCLAIEYLTKRLTPFFWWVCPENHRTENRRKD